MSDIKPQIDLRAIGGGITCSECGRYFKDWYRDSMPEAVEETVRSAMTEVGVLQSNLVIIDSAHTPMVSCPGCQAVIPIPTSPEELINLLPDEDGDLIGPRGLGVPDANP